VVTESQGTVTVEMFPARPGDLPIVVALVESMTLRDLEERLDIPADTEAVIVNGSYVTPDYRLQDGDRVRVIRFMSGG
jgi:sulfur carrier protein ThiS